MPNAYIKCCSSALLEHSAAFFSRWKKKVFEDPVVTKHVIMQERQKQMNEQVAGVQTFYYSTCTKTFQVDTLAVKVDWLIHDISHALNNMQDNIPP